jgi:hypothetical protein
MAAELAREKKHCAPYLAALGQLVSRAPVYAGPETVVSPDLVERAYEIFRRFDWSTPLRRQRGAMASVDGPADGDCWIALSAYPGDSH